LVGLVNALAYNPLTQVRILAFVVVEDCGGGGDDDYDDDDISE
jgi:hypothetical protein